MNKIKADKILSILPTMSSDIADSSRHEQILAFFSSISIELSVEQVAALKLAIKHSDHRVRSLAIRIYGLHPVYDKEIIELVFENGSPFDILEYSNSVYHRLEFLDDRMARYCNEGLKSLDRRTRLSALRLVAKGVSAEPQDIVEWCEASSEVKLEYWSMLIDRIFENRALRIMLNNANNCPISSERIIEKLNAANLTEMIGAVEAVRLLLKLQYSKEGIQQFCSEIIDLILGNKVIVKSDFSQLIGLLQGLSLKQFQRIRTRLMSSVLSILSTMETISETRNYVSDVISNIIWKGFPFRPTLEIYVTLHSLDRQTIANIFNYCDYTYDCILIILPRLLSCDWEWVFESVLVRGDWREIDDLLYFFGNQKFEISVRIVELLLQFTMPTIQASVFRFLEKCTLNPETTAIIEKELLKQHTPEVLLSKFNLMINKNIFVDAGISILHKHEDYEIRSIVVNLLAKIYQLEQSLFYSHNGDTIVQQAILDDSRFVREAAFKLLLQVKRNTTDKSKFKNWAIEIDAERGIADCDPELLYSGVEITESLYTEKNLSGEGNNILQCYDC